MTKRLSKTYENLESKLHQIHYFHTISKHHLQPLSNGNTTTSTEPTIGININALEWATGKPILDVLWRWEHIIRKQRNLTAPALLPKYPNEVHEAINFQLNHLQWILDQEQLTNSYQQQIHQLWKDGQQATRNQPEPSRRIPCPSPTLDKNNEPTSCRNILTIEQHNIEKQLHCQRCNTTWTVARLVNVALATSNTTFWLDAESIANWIGITERHVRRLARSWGLDKRGSLYPFQTFVIHYKQELDLT